MSKKKKNHVQLNEEKKKKKTEEEEEGNAQEIQKKEKKMKKKKKAMYNLRKEKRKRKKGRQRPQDGTKEKRKRKKRNLTNCPYLAHEHFCSLNNLIFSFQFSHQFEEKTFQQVRRENTWTPLFIFLPPHPNKYTPKSFHFHFLSKVFHLPYFVFKQHTLKQEEYANLLKKS